MKSSSNIVSAVQHLKMAQEHLKDFNRDNPNTRGSKLFQTYIDKIEWISCSDIPSNEEILVEKERLLQEYLALEYQRKRKAEYPPLADLADAIYWQAQGDESKMTAYVAACEAVKVKYPKGV